MTEKINIRALCVTAIMGALGLVLMLIEFPVPFIPTFIKMDFSEVPALITGFAFGPLWGVGVCLLKNILHLFFTSSMGVGELSNFLLGSILVLVSSVIYSRKKTKKTAILSAVLGSVIMALSCVVLNYYAVYPLYARVLGFSMEAILGMYREIAPKTVSLFAALLIFNLPFTLCKGLIDTLLCSVLYNPLRPFVKGKKQ